jgi:hypothetical protein
VRTLRTFMPGRIQAVTGADYKRIFAVLAQKESFLPNIPPLAQPD